MEGHKQQCGLKWSKAFRERKRKAWRVKEGMLRLLGSFREKNRKRSSYLRSRTA